MKNNCGFTRNTFNFRLCILAINKRNFVICGKESVIRLAVFSTMVAKFISRGHNNIYNVLYPAKFFYLIKRPIRNIRQFGSISP